MTKTPYRVLKWTLLASIASSLALAACTVTTGGSVDDDGGEGGTTSKAGKTSGGTTSDAGKTSGGSGGTAAGTGGSAAGTGGSTAGMGGTTPTYEVGQCQADNPTPSVEPSCAPDAAKDKDNPCQVCMKAKCCTVWQACFGSEPTTACFHGPSADAAKDPGQFDCIRFCFDENKDMLTDPNELLADCGSKCSQQCDTPDNGTIMDSTSDLVACANKDCVDECFPFGG
jgi:hypothetical protein